MLIERAAHAEQSSSHVARGSGARSGTADARWSRMSSASASRLSTTALPRSLALPTSTSDGFASSRCAVAQLVRDRGRRPTRSTDQALSIPRPIERPESVLYESSRVPGVIAIPRLLPSLLASGSASTDAIPGRRRMNNSGGARPAPRFRSWWSRLKPKPVRGSASCERVSAATTRRRPSRRLARPRRFPLVAGCRQVPALSSRQAPPRRINRPRGRRRPSRNSSSGSRWGRSRPRGSPRGDIRAAREAARGRRPPARPELD